MIMEGQINAQQSQQQQQSHSSTRHTPPAQQTPASFGASMNINMTNNASATIPLSSTATAPHNNNNNNNNITTSSAIPAASTAHNNNGTTKADADILSEGLDVFDLQLRKEYASAPGHFIIGSSGLAGNPVGSSPSPPIPHTTAAFSSIATVEHALTVEMSNPQVTRSILHELAQVLLRHTTHHGAPQPEEVTEEDERRLLLHFTEELQRGLAVGTGGGSHFIGAPLPPACPPPPGPSDGRWTIDKEVQLSLKSGRGEGLPPPGAEGPRPHHPYAGYSGVLSGVNTINNNMMMNSGSGNMISPRVTAQPLWRGTPPIIQHNNNSNNNNNNNSSSAMTTTMRVVGIGGGVADTISTTAPVLHHASLTPTTLSKRVGGGDVIRPQPQHVKSGAKGMSADHRHVTTSSTKKVLRSASSAFSEYSAGDTGEVSSSMSRTTVGTSTLKK